MRKEPMETLVSNLSDYVFSSNG